MSITDALRLLLTRWQLQEIDDPDLQHEHSRLLELFGAAEMDAALFGLLEQEDPVNQVLALDLLGRGQAKESEYRISEYLADSDPELRAAAVLALWRRGAWGYLDQVLPLLSNEDWEVRAQVVDFIRSAGPERVKARLLPFLQDPCPGVRASAADICGETSEVERIVPLLQDPSPEVRAAAVSSLASHGSSYHQRISALRSDTSQDVRKAVEEYLQNL